MKQEGERIENYQEFWDFYIAEHSQSLTRYLHFVGTALGLGLLVWFIRNGTWYYFPLSLAVGYAFSWISHFFVERNKPATFTYPLWSFVSDYRMVLYMLTGKINTEMERILSKRASD